MDLRKIKKLIELLEESGIAEIEVKEGEESIKLSRASQVQQQPIINTQTYDVPPVREPVIQTPAKQEDIKPDPVADGDTIDSPMVGTFYRAASPESEEFVTDRASVQSGQTLCIVEAMKIMNEIPADRSGTIVEILVGNGEPVEYDQPLFRIRPD